MGEEVTGEDDEENQVASNPANTVFDAKRLIGRRFEDTFVREGTKHWPFKVVSDAGGRPMIEVEYKGETKLFAPEEISSMVLAKMKETAEAYLNAPVTKAVITVPANFSNAQVSVDRYRSFILNTLLFAN